MFTLAAVRSGDDAMECGGVDGDANGDTRVWMVGTWRKPSCAMWSHSTQSPQSVKGPRGVWDTSLMVSRPLSRRADCDKRRLRRAGGRSILETHLLDRLLAHEELLYLPGDGHGKRLDELPVARNLDRGDLATAVRGQLLGGRRLTLL